MDYPDFCGPSFVAQSPFSDGEKTMNFYAESASVPGQSGPMALYPTPGVTKLVTADDAPGRALAVAAGRMVCVMGRTLYEMSDTYVLTSRNPRPQW